MVALGYDFREPKLLGKKNSLIRLETGCKFKGSAPCLKMVMAGLRFVKNSIGRDGCFAPYPHSNGDICIQDSVLLYMLPSRSY